MASNYVVISEENKSNEKEQYIEDNIPAFSSDGNSSDNKEAFDELEENISRKTTASGKMNIPHVTFQLPPSSDAIKHPLENSPDINIVNSSEYVARASTTRSKIEEKITEIEKKMDLPALDSSSESLDMVSSAGDYNLIKVLDPRRSRSCSISEMRQSTIDRLQSKLEKAEKDLELKAEEVMRLRKIRDEVGSEIEDLTASLFEEANNMVRNAQVKQHKAEKNAKEANMKLGMLQEEVQALKAIVQSTTMYTSAIDNPNMQQKKTIPQRESYEVDPTFNDEFVKWRQNPNLDKETPFMKRIYEEDIKACLYFRNTELSELVLSAIEEDKITIEKISVAKHEPLPKICDLMNAPRLCPYKMYLDGKNSYNISALSRNRITAICDLFCYLRYIQKGLISLRIHEVYLEILKKRRRITSAKLGLIDDIVE
ncbi:guanine nucleotide exchange factor for Rab-3A [Nephila pilipes]|uniref:Guanine nucleotide exchange factor for Rab-3A n=1 Tax=Nephila pilipes TaxID=299642 RepID=A0A8X6PSZ7_NEPPI|nr:guanine nucleotide exchange factor for Rab-3A [Nephila pilipes]